MGETGGRARARLGAGFTPESGGRPRADLCVAYWRTWACFIFLTVLEVNQPAAAGPATYDPQTRCFHLTYTFAALPSGGFLSTRHGMVQKPSPEQEANVRLLVGHVSQLLEDATAGRARIGSLDYVDAIKDADLVISLTGMPPSAGWAVLQAIEGNPGQIALYYQTLEPQFQDEVVGTAAHELCHYIFGLTDEYDSSHFPHGCPPRRGQPGCLMDNYLRPPSGRGYMGRLCGPGEHWPSAVQRTSCQELVDQFFEMRGVKVPEGSEPLWKQTPAERESVLASATLLVRSRLRAQQGCVTTSWMETLARGAIREVLRSRQTNQLSMSELNENDLESLAAEVLARCRAPDEVDSPVLANLDPALRAELESEAHRLCQQNSRVTKLEPLLYYRVLGGLRQYLSNAEPGGNHDQALGDRAARYQVAVQLTRRALAGRVAHLAPQQHCWLEVRQAEAPPAGLLPGRDSSSFGLRRTRFITPTSPPAEPEWVLTQGGVSPYGVLRDRAFQDFARLLDHQLIELAQPHFGANEATVFAPSGSPENGPFDNPADDPQQHLRARYNSDLSSFLTDLAGQIDGGRLENVVVLVPPGGLPRNLGEALRSMEVHLQKASGLRLDLVLVGSARVDPVLRDLSVRSRGSVVTILDVDELGAISQRLHHQQSHGSWLIVPQPGRIPAVPASSSLEALRQKTDAEAAAITAALEEAVRTIQRLRPLTPVPAPQSRLMKTREALESIEASVRRLQASLSQQDLGPPAVSGQGSNDLQGYFSLLAQTRGGLDPARSAIETSLESAAADPLSPKLEQLLENLLLPGLLGPRFHRVERFIRLHDLTFETLLRKTGQDLPVFMRLDRVAIENRRRELDEESLSPAPSAFLRLLAQESPRRVRLPRFYTEDGSSLELIIGLSRPLPSHPEASGRDGLGASFDPSTALCLYNDQGRLVDRGERLRFDPDKSSPTSLVYRTTLENPIEPGGYSPFFTIDDAGSRQLAEDPIHFTFSVGTGRSNVELIAALRETATDADRGLVHKSQGYADVEVQLLYARPIVGPRVQGFVQVIAPGTEPISFQELSFEDEGPALPGCRDRIAGDGIVTGSLPLDGIPDGAEVRVFIEADAGAGCRWLQWDHAGGAEDGQIELEATVPRFQRATSVHFQVEP